MFVHDSSKRHYMMDLTASATYADLLRAVRARCGGKLAQAKRLRLVWLRGGETVELSQATWREYIFTNWCDMPWAVHVHDETNTKP